MFGRQLPQWFGRQGMPPPTDPSLMGMLPQVPGQAPQPQIPQQQAPTFTPVAAPQATAGQVGPDREAAMRQQMLAETMGKQYGDRSNVNSPLTAGLYALNQGLGSFLDKKATESKNKLASSDRKALIDALNSADPMSALGGLQNPEAQNAFIQMKLQGMAPKTEPVDVDNDGKPDYLRDPKGNLSPYPQTAAEQQAAQVALYQQTTGRENALNRAQQAQLAQMAQRAKAAGNVDPNTGVRVAPPGVQGRDYAELSKIRTSADAAASIAATLNGVAPALDQMQTGPGNAAGRTFMGIASVIPGLSSAQDFVKNYDAIEQASKTIGIDTLQKVGGSDTERELLTAIQTTVNNDVLPEENMRRFKDQIVAADILAKKAQFATEWVNKVGSLQYTAPNGMSWPQFWSEYQKSAWADHRGATQKGAKRGAGQQPQAQGGAAAPPPGFKVIP